MATGNVVVPVGARKFIGGVYDTTKPNRNER